MSLSSSSSSSNFLDVWSWINNLPPFSEWSTNTMSIYICNATSLQPSMSLSITKTSKSKTSYIYFAILANYQIPVSLWLSNSFPLKSKSQESIDEGIIAQFFLNIINGVLNYGPKRRFSFRYPAVHIHEEFKDMFNVAFITLAFLVCIYEAPQDLRSTCIEALKAQIQHPRSREASKSLVRVLGSNIEEQWMKSFNLAITNRIIELQALEHSFRTPSSLFSYGLSTAGLWKVQLYCPIIAMHLEDPNTSTQDEKLLFSLRYQQLEGVIQLAYKVIYMENWIDVVVSVDNVRLVKSSSQIILN